MLGSSAALPHAVNNTDKTSLCQLAKPEGYAYTASCAFMLATETLPECISWQRNYCMHQEEVDQTLVLIKPDALKNSVTGFLLSQLSEFHTGSQFAATKIVQVSRMLAEQHYAEHQGKAFYPSLIDYIMGHAHYPDDASKLESSLLSIVVPRFCRGYEMLPARPILTSHERKSRDVFVPWARWFPSRTRQDV